MSLVYEGRAYKLKRAGKQKYWRCSKDKKGCGGAIWTNLDVTSVIMQNDHIESCPVDEHLAYKMEKKALLKKRSAEETKPIPAIYDEEASAASAEPSTSGYFPLFKRAASSHANLGHGWYIQGCTTVVSTTVYHSCFCGGATSQIRGYRAATSTSARRYIGKSVSWDENTISNGRSNEKKDKNAPGHAFLPVPEVDMGVSLLEAGTTGNLLALFQYFWQEWMTDERLPLWNVHNVNIRTNNHLEGWHNRLNRKADKSHNGLYELLQILIAEQGVMDTLIQQVLSGNATVGDLRRVNRVYAEKQEGLPSIRVITPAVVVPWSSSLKQIRGSTIHVWHSQCAILTYLERATSRIRGYRAATSTSARRYIGKSVSWDENTISNGRSNEKKDKNAFGHGFPPCTGKPITTWKVGTRGSTEKRLKVITGCYELLQILIAEQGVMDTLIRQVLSGNATVGDLRRVNKVYAEKQQRVAQYTGEYTNGSRTLEQFLEALMYITPEPI
ncbi:hypothetical protein T07_13777 [Trichinella nelsoni]|uniref:FLYWCH-type domain-containing protein n=1 Tax=Trichinella nelsoni TaxID=6336 RepID=A0A0V0RV59_9BILA|nr:hypothetical protein T07_13777 [Trichinella nelsoni]